MGAAPHPFDRRATHLRTRARLRAQPPHTPCDTRWPRPDPAPVTASRTKLGDPRHTPYGGERSPCGHGHELHSPRTPPAPPSAAPDVLAGAADAGGDRRRSRRPRDRAVPRPAQRAARRPGHAPRARDRADHGGPAAHRRGPADVAAVRERARADRRRADPPGQRGRVRGGDEHERRALVAQGRHPDRPSRLHRPPPDPRRQGRHADRQRHTGAIGARQGAVAPPWAHRRRGLGRHQVRQCAQPADPRHPGPLRLRGRSPGRRCVRRVSALPPGPAADP